jgi:hemolysin D
MPNNNYSSTLPPKQEPTQNGHNLAPVRLEEYLPQPDPPSEVSATFPSIHDQLSYATQELLDSLPQAWPRGLLYVLIVCIAIILPWAGFSKVDETGTAQGRLEPKGSVFRLDTPVPGTVAAVKVKEGQTVRKGQVLMELESDLLHGDLQDAQMKLEGQLSRQAQLELLINQLFIALRTQAQQNQAQQLEKEAQVNQAQQNVFAGQTLYPSQKLEKEAQVDQAQQNLNATTKAYELANRRFLKDRAQVDFYRQLVEKGIIPAVKVFELERLADESQQQLAQAFAEMKRAKLRLKEQQGNYQNAMDQAKSGIQQAGLRLKEQQGGYQKLNYTGQLAVLKSEEQLKNLQTQSSTLKTEIAQSKSRLQSLKFQLAQRVLRAPVSGVIFQLPITKAKSVLQSGQLIAQIAPQGSTLILKAEMPSQESGFLSVGMPAKVKFDAYPFQDYGVVPGHLNWIAPDSKTQKNNQGESNSYELEIALHQLDIQTEHKRIPLTPGQTATAEVVIRQRRVIDFILDPFRKLNQGGIKL